MPTYLIDHSAYRPNEENKVVAMEVYGHAQKAKQFSDGMLNFGLRVFSKSGISPHGSFLPKSVHPKYNSEPQVSVPNALAEAEEVMSGALSDLFHKTGVRPCDVDILVTCCSIFCPTPSLSAMLVHKFNMREDIQSYSLGGMGCGTGVVGVSLIRDLLKARPNSIAVFVPSEITAAAYYPGAEKHRMVSNMIFRMGGAASMFSNKPSMRSRAKYELVAASRVHMAANDEAYACMSWGPDSKEVNGVHLGKEVPVCAGATINAACTAIAPYILSWSDYGRAAYYAAQKKLLGASPEFKPDWMSCCNHFALHAGGYAVLKGLQKGLNLHTEKMLPSFACLRDYGNTSCSTTWYSMGYIESQIGCKKGEQILQVGVGGGTKAGVACWRALRDVHTPHKAWLHLDKPYTEADLPRSIFDGALRDPAMAKLEAEATGNEGSIDGIPTHAA